MIRLLQRGLPGAWWAPLLLLLVCLLLGPWNEVALADFSLSRRAVRGGEIWRLLTGHAVHTTWPHLALNLGGLVALHAMFSAELRPVLCVWGYTLLALATSICLLAFNNIGTYTGLSGVLHGMFVFAACLAFRRDGLLAGGVVLLVSAKVLYEQLRGPASAMEQLIGLPVAVDAHFYGSVAGAVLGALVVAGRRS